jgi:hypothetical protein
MKTYVAKRNFRSEEEAIKKISSRFGLAKVLEIGNDYLLEEYVEFEKIDLSLDQLSYLLKDIHSIRNNSGLYLVHGDFSQHNTTLFEGNAKCFDYEYSHFGNTYADVGRILLRECRGFKDTELFFNIYSNGFPKCDELKEGLIYFCNWQNELRKEKNLPYQEVPLIRGKRIEKVRNKLEDILNAFKFEVKNK